MTIVEYLKKQAKRLHKAVKAGDVEASRQARETFKDLESLPDGELSKAFSLMRAQHVVASQLGFKKWDELKAAPDIEVRMALTLMVHPNLSDLGLEAPAGVTAVQLSAARRKLRGKVELVSAVLGWLDENVEASPAANRGISMEEWSLRIERDLGAITPGVLTAAAIIRGIAYETDESGLWFAMNNKSGAESFPAQPKSRPGKFSLNSEHNIVRQLEKSAALFGVPKFIRDQERMMERLNPVPKFIRDLEKSAALFDPVPKFIRDQEALMERLNPVPKFIRDQEKLLKMELPRFGGQI